MDTLYVLGNSSKYDNLELRLLPRSLEQNTKGLESVFIVGEKPDWIKNSSRYQGIQNKILVELQSKEITRVMDYRVHCPIIFNKPSKYEK